MLPNYQNKNEETQRLQTNIELRIKISKSKILEWLTSRRS